jgi:hypothetical protein
VSAFFGRSRMTLSSKTSAQLIVPVRVGLHLAASDSTIAFRGVVDGVEPTGERHPQRSVAGSAHTIPIAETARHVG